MSPASKKPGTFRSGVISLLILSSLGFGVLIGSRMGIPFLDRSETWAIGVYEGPSPFEITPAQGARNPVLTAQEVDDVDAAFVADPFAVVQDSAVFLFFEVMNRSTKQGDIAFATGVDGLEWKYGKVVLDEPFHLSYPQVFEWDDEYYLIPETEKDFSVRLYRAARFPDRWEFVGKILEGRHFLDPTIFRWNDYWWLFVSFPGNDVLALYLAEELTGPWREHPASPVVFGDPNTSRPGGRVVQVDGQLFRLGQDDAPSYGNQLFAVRILALSPTQYEEGMVLSPPVLAASGSGWNAEGMHHLDSHFLAGRWLGFVDGKSTKTTISWPF